jgi:thioredoxin 1
MREVTDASFERDVLAAGHPVAVDFWAPWCGPCHAVTRALEELAAESEGIEFVQLDIDANPVTAARYDVLSIPTVILFADGEPRESVVGARRPSHFRAVLAPFLTEPSAP